jgi:hypothetical protein
MGALALTENAAGPLETLAAIMRVMDHLVRAAIENRRADITDVMSFP